MRSQQLNCISQTFLTGHNSSGKAMGIAFIDFGANFHNLLKSKRLNESAKTLSADFTNLTITFLLYTIPCKAISLINFMHWRQLDARLLTICITAWLSQNTMICPIKSVSFFQAVSAIDRA